MAIDAHANLLGRAVVDHLHRSRANGARDVESRRVLGRLHCLTGSVQPVIPLGKTKSVQKLFRTKKLVLHRRDGATTVCAATNASVCEAVCTDLIFICAGKVSTARAYFVPDRVPGLPEAVCDAVQGTDINRRGVCRTSVPRLPKGVAARDAG